MLRHIDENFHKLRARGNVEYSESTSVRDSAPVFAGHQRDRRLVRREIIEQPGIDRDDSRALVQGSVRQKPGAFAVRRAAAYPAKMTGHHPGTKAVHAVFFRAHRELFGGVVSVQRATFVTNRTIAERDSVRQLRIDAKRRLSAVTSAADHRYLIVLLRRQRHSCFAAWAS